MSASREERREKIVNRLIELYSGPYKAAKRKYSVNTDRYDKDDKTTLTHLLDILELTDNVLESIGENDYEEAEETLGRLEREMYLAVINAACVPLDRELNWLERHRLEWDSMYILTRKEVPSSRQYQNRIQHAKNLRDSADEMPLTAWGQRVTKYEKALEKVEGLREDTPTRTQMKHRLIGAVVTLLSLAIGIGGLLV